MMGCHFFLVNVIFNIEKSNINIFCSFSATGFSVDFQQHRQFIILIEPVLIDLEVLFF